MSVSLKQSYDIEYNGTANVSRMDLFVDTTADLTGLTTFDSITLLQGSTAKDISTGDVYMMQTGGTWVKQPSQSASANVYTKSEIDSMLYLHYTKAEADALFEWATFTTDTITTDTMPLRFISDGSPLSSLSMLGNERHTGTPTPGNPVMPEFVGILSGSYWTIPVTCAKQTATVNLGTTQTVRRIKKVVFTGQETWTEVYPGEPEAQGIVMYATTVSDIGTDRNDFICSHFFVGNYSGYLISGQGRINGRSPEGFTVNYNNGSGGLQNFKSWLASEYAAGHPVTLWYALATEQTAIVNEPLAKIGTYADELHSTDSAVTIPITRGENTLTIGTTLQPSEITITGKIREVTENEQ